jgi:hypothetical protein
LVSPDTSSLKRIIEPRKKLKTGFLVSLDVIVIYWNGLKKYIFTTIDCYSNSLMARLIISKQIMVQNFKDCFRIR